MQEDLREYIIDRLYRRTYIGDKHTSIDNLQKGVPGHLKGDAKKVAKQLIKENILLAKKTSYSLEVSLNPKKLKEIKPDL